MITASPIPLEPSILEALALANRVLHSREFEEAFLAVDLIETNGKLPVDVLADVRSPIDVKIRWWRPWNPWTSAVAYFERGVIYLNSRKSWPCGDLIDCLIHEQCHGKGYGHSFKWTKDRDRTVPYAAQHSSTRARKAMGICI